MRNVLHKSCRENPNTTFMFNTFSSNIVPFMNNVEKYGGARGATNDVTIWRVRVACWLCKATRAHTHALISARTH